MKIAEAPLDSGKASVASFWARTDSYELGRKLAWSELETLASEGANGTITATAITQVTMIRHGWATTYRPKRSNKKIPPRRAGQP